MSETIRKGDFLLVAIRCDSDEEIHPELAFDDIMREVPRWIREQAEYRGVERKEARRDP